MCGLRQAHRRRGWVRSGIDFLDRWPGWVMTLIVVGCIVMAVWLLTRTHDITFGQLTPFDRDVVRRAGAVS